MTIASPDSLRISSGSTRNVTVSFHDTLDSGVTLTLSTIAEVTTTDLTITNKAINTAEVTVPDNGETVTVAVGQAAQCTVAGGTAGLSYLVRITVTTSESETIEYDQRMDFV